MGTGSSVGSDEPPARPAESPPTSHLVPSSSREVAHNATVGSASFASAGSPSSPGKESSRSFASHERMRDLGLEDDQLGPEQQSPTKVTNATGGAAGASHAPKPSAAKSPGSKTKRIKVVRKVTRKVVSKSNGHSHAASVLGDSEELDTSRLFTGTTVHGWTKGKLIGKGATGSVYRAVEHSTGKYFCVKEIEFGEDLADNPADCARLEQLKAEIALLQDVHHANVVRFIDIDKVGYNIYILMELVAGGTLSEIIKQFGALSDAKAREYTRQITEGLAYLHDKNIVHRDIKGANILVGIDGTIKLADFGAAKRILDPQVLFKTLAGTPYWMAPEVVRQEGHGKPADIWSLGATVLQMITGLAPYQSLPPVAALFKIGHGKDVPLPDSASTSPLVVDFVNQCLRRDAAQRPTARALLSHAWLQSSRPAVSDSGLLSAVGEAHHPTPDAQARRVLLEHDEGGVEETDEIREYIRHVMFVRALDDNAEEAGGGDAAGAPPGDDPPLNDDDVERLMAGLQAADDGQD